MVTPDDGGFAAFQRGFRRAGVDYPCAYLLAEEAVQFGRAIKSRTREFTTAQSCARLALSKLGLPAVAILSGPKREQLWPPGVVGSITHCRNS
jgi:4'-phosphopantetheinyl transferase EntD